MIHWMSSTFNWLIWEANAAWVFSAVVAFFVFGFYFVKSLDEYVIDYFRNQKEDKKIWASEVKRLTKKSSEANEARPASLANYDGLLASAQEKLNKLNSESWWSKVSTSLIGTIFAIILSAFSSFVAWALAIVFSGIVLFFFSVPKTEIKWVDTRITLVAANDFLRTNGSVGGSIFFVSGSIDTDLAYMYAAKDTDGYIKDYRVVKDLYTEVKYKDDDPKVTEPYLIVSKKLERSLPQTNRWLIKGFDSNWRYANPRETDYYYFNLPPGSVLRGVQFDHK